MRRFSASPEYLIGSWHMSDPANSTAEKGPENTIPGAETPPVSGESERPATGEGPALGAAAGAAMPLLSTYLRRWITIRDQPGPAEQVLMGMACVLCVLVVWHVLTTGTPEERIVGNLTLPSLTETVKSFGSLWFDRALARSALWSLARVLGGFLLAAAVGIPLGVSAGALRRLRAFLRPVSVFGRNVPIAALIPLTLIWFGLGETQKVMFIFFACVAFVFFDSVRAVDDVPDTYLDTAYTLGARFLPKRGAARAALAGLGYASLFGAAFLVLVEWPGKADSAALWSTWSWGLAASVGVGFFLGFVLWFPILSFQAVQKVLLPLGLPDIMNSLRLLFGLAFGYIMLAEVINAEHGLGSIIILSQRRGPREHIYLALVIIALLAFAIDRVILLTQRRLFPYRHTGEG
ncbi:ABC transporter permease [Thermodesulfobacteriota bacterium]